MAIPERGPDGKFLPGTLQPPYQITKANASTLARLRWDRQRAAFATGVVQTLQDTGQLPANAQADDLDAAAWQAVAGKAATLLLDTDNPVGFERLASFTGRAAGWIPDKADKDSQDSSGVTLHLDGDVVASLLDAWQARRDAE